MGERLFQLTVDGERPANEAHRPRAGAEPVEGALAGRDHLGDVAEAEVVVRGQDHDLATPFHLDPAVLGGGEVVEALVDAIALELVELGLEPGSQAHAISRMIFPAPPERIAARASSIRARGNWCVMTGRGSRSPDVR